MRIEGLRVLPFPTYKSLLRANRSGMATARKPVTLVLSDLRSLIAVANGKSETV